MGSFMAVGLEAVARMSRARDGCVMRRAVQNRDHAPAPAVRQLDDGALVAASGIDRHHDREIRLKRDEAVSVARGECQVDDAAVGRMERINGEMRDPIDLLESACTAEPSA
jgi:hypothetical protein